MVAYGILENQLCNTNDPARFIGEIPATDNGEVAKPTIQMKRELLAEES